MRMEKLSVDEKYNICRKYYIGGWFFLPWLWILNFIWFFNEARKSSCDPRIRKMVLISGIGGAVWIVGCAIWTSTFLKKRASWGAEGDNLSVNIPMGYA